LGLFILSSYKNFLELFFVIFKVIGSFMVLAISNVKGSFMILAISNVKGFFMVLAIFKGKGFLDFWTFGG
jgi:hypothetical protein